MFNTSNGVEKFDGFTDDQVKALSEKLDIRNVKTRTGGGGLTLSYIEGWWAIREANRIFGFGMWERHTEEHQIVHEGEKETNYGKRFTVSYTCKCTITVHSPEAKDLIVRQGMGAGHGISKNPGEAHEAALKEAETDAMKRAFMTFGNSFGLALYDRDQEEVECEPYEYDLPEPKEGSSTDAVAQYIISLGARIDGDKVRSTQPIEALEEKKKKSRSIEMNPKALEVKE